MDSACKELLSNARLAFNKYRGTSQRHLACALPDLLHNGAFSQDLVEIDEALGQRPLYNGHRRSSPVVQDENRADLAVMIDDWLSAGVR